MSQRGGADARPASSSGLTGSPPTPSRPGTATSAAGYNAPPAGGNQGIQHVPVGDDTWRSGGMSRANGPHAQGHHVQQQHQHQQRSFGVQHILNPSESYAASPMAGPARVNDALGRSPPSDHHPLSPRRTSMALGPSHDHGSPVAHPQHPAIGSARRILTPRSPRAASVSHASGLRALNPQQPQQQAGYPPTTGPPPPPHSVRARTFSSSADGSTPEQSPRMGSAQPQPLPWTGPGAGSGGPGLSRLAPYSTPPRSVSQPVTGTYGSHSHPQQPYQQQPHQGQQQPPHGGPEGRSHQLTPNTSPYSQTIPPSTRGPPSSKPPSEASYTPAPSAASPHSQQGQMPARPDGSSVTPTGQAYMAINPLNGEQMLVPIETYQASKVANEKRNRNAGASARFRARKKDREQHKDLTLQRLETHNRELEMRVVEQEEVIQHYRNERDRLREIIQNTPQISHFARGPPSPVLSRAPEPLGGTSSAAPSPVSQMMPHPSMLGPPPGASSGSGGMPPEYMPSDSRPSARRSAPEPLPEQRETRRRRTEGAPAPPPVLVEFGTPNYGPASTPGSLPPIPSPSYSSLSNPGTPSGHGAGRPSMLPPLRMDQPSGSVTPEQQHAQPPHHHQYQGHPSTTMPPYRRDAYESGWATAPPREGPPPPPPSR